MKIINNVTAHDKREWSRMAQAAYASNRNDIGHRYSVASATIGDECDTARFDKLQSGYRAWLVFNEFPQS